MDRAHALRSAFDCIARRPGFRVAQGVHFVLRDMDSYISSELIAKLRQDQGELRTSIRALERAAQQADLQRFANEVHALAVRYAAHERLVRALLEAVEPDDGGGRAAF